MSGAGSFAHERAKRILLEEIEITLPPFRAQLSTLLTDHLRRTNRDYREAFCEYPALLPVLVDVHRRGEGPFAGTESRIKFKYVAKG